MWQGWQDYIAIVSGIAATVMGGVTLMTSKLPPWKKWLIIVLAITAIGTTSFTAWWTHHEKGQEEARRIEIIETLGKFIADGDRLNGKLYGSPPPPLPAEEYADWKKRTENFLRTLGPSFVIRFNSEAGLETNLSPQGYDQAHISYWIALRMRIARLHQFLSEYSGQIPREN